MPTRASLGRPVLWFTMLQRWLELVPTRAPQRFPDPDILLHPDLALERLSELAPLVRARLDALASLELPARCGPSFVVTDQVDPGLIEPHLIEDELDESADGIVLSAARPWVFVLHHEGWVFGAELPAPTRRPPALATLRRSVADHRRRELARRDRERARIGADRLDAAHKLGGSRRELAREFGLSLAELLRLQGPPRCPRWLHELDP